MDSDALISLSTALSEIDDLREIVGHVRLGKKKWLQKTKTVGRAQTVLLSAHFERYIYAVNEAAVEFVNMASEDNTSLLPPLRLLHSAVAVEEIARISWENRQEKLESFIKTDAWLWTTNERAS